jgi:hypothetical protein
MAKKKDRAFFICPRWNEIADPARTGGRPIRIHQKILASIRDRQPVARSTLRKALLAVCQASGSMIGLDAYIVDRRVNQPR